MTRGQNKGVLQEKQPKGGCKNVKVASLPTLLRLTPFSGSSCVAHTSLDLDHDPGCALGRRLIWKSLTLLCLLLAYSSKRGGEGSATIGLILAILHRWVGNEWTRLMSAWSFDCTLNALVSPA